MRRMTAVLGVLLIAAVAASAQVDPAMGNWEGKMISKGYEGQPVSAKVTGTGRDSYACQLYVGEPAVRGDLEGIADEDAVVFVGTVDLADRGGVVRVTAQIVDDVFMGVMHEQGKPNARAFRMSRVVKTPPTLGAEPPEGAVVLLDGTNLDAWEALPGNLVGDTLRIGANSYRTREEFGSFRLHLEFRCPYMPEATGQGRGNSGVYLQSRYEIQVLDSFGDAPADNGCGGIYQIAVPLTNPSLPPMEWQTYDIDFTTAQFENGQKTANARVTVRHNGVVIHDDVELPNSTAGGAPEDDATGPLFLQDHNDAVHYRNIWLVKTD